MKYERMKLRHALFAIDSKFKKKKKYVDDESDLDDDAIATHEDVMKDKEIEKTEKKFLKDNEKLAEEGKKPQDDSVLKDKIKEYETRFSHIEADIALLVNELDGITGDQPLRSIHPRI